MSELQFWKFQNFLSWLSLCVRIVVSDPKPFCGSMKLSQEGADHDELFP